MLYADDAGVVSKTAEGLEQIMDIRETMFAAAGLTVSAKETDTMRMQAVVQKLPTEPLDVAQQIKGTFTPSVSLTSAT